MSSVLFGAAMVLLAFLAVNVVASAAVMTVAPFVRARLGSARPAAQGRVFLVLRLLPAGAATAAAALLVLPAYLLLEPANTGERLSPALVVLSLLALALWTCGLVRGERALAATGALVRGWSRSAQTVRLPASDVPAYRVQDPLPVFAVVGLRRPRIYVSTQVLAALTPSELEASAAHEVAHLLARDNLKRLLMRSCPDLLALFPAGAALEADWARAAEAEADARAVSGRRETALELASGLVKVARLAPARGAALPVSALHDGGDVEVRVRRLLALEAGHPTRPSRGRAEWLLALAAAAGGAAVAAGVLPAVHRLIEAAARLLG